MWTMVFLLSNEVNEEVGQDLVKKLHRGLVGKFGW